MERITQKDLERLVDEINDSNDIEKDAKHYTVGAHRLDYAYGGVKLVKINTEGGGQSTISNDGYGTKRQLYNFLRAFTTNVSSVKNTIAYTTKTLYNGAIVPNIIKTDERIFMITTFDGEACLCNLETAYQCVKKGMVKSLKHFWDWKFVSFGKSDLIDMYNSMYPNKL